MKDEWATQGLWIDAMNEMRQGLADKAAVEAIDLLRPLFAVAANGAADAIKQLEFIQADPAKFRQEMARRLQDLFNQELTQALDLTEAEIQEQGGRS
jgi:non-ribosomal peptide synthetase component E (peptide arylation enzyme)